MAQVSIREFDAKKMYSDFSKTSYNWGLACSPCQSDDVEVKPPYVIKPDQLFGQRGKHWLLWVNLSKADMKQWIRDHRNKQVTVNWVIWTLHTFLIEPFIPHEEEFYVAIRTQREHDEILFSTEWWVEVEQNWDKVKTIQVWMLDSVSETLIKNSFSISDSKIVKYIYTLYDFFKSYGFAYLEVNPFTFNQDWNIVALDMVARIDDAEHFKQKTHWNDLEFPEVFWADFSDAENYIRSLDEKTGASLKFRILNPEWKIWTMTAWWGGSLVIADAIWELWYINELANYWECSWNPDRENTREYARMVITEMLKNKKKWKYFIIAWAIANFTHIDKTFAGIIDVFKEKKNELIKQNVKILVRRWWINDKIGLQMMKEACEELWLSVEIADGNIYMTEILNSINF